MKLLITQRNYQMKTLQTTQKKPYATPVIEVLEAENDMKFLMASTTVEDPTNPARRVDFEDGGDGFGTEE